MAEDTPAPEPVGEADAAAVGRPLWQRVAKWTGIALAGLVLAIGALVLGLDTQAGRRFVADQIAGITLESGLNFRIGRIDGSLYGAMVLRNVQVRDTRGVFAASREIRMDWRPLAYLGNRVDVRSLASPEVKLLRLPALKPSGDPNAPLLPDLNIDVGNSTSPGSTSPGKWTVAPVISAGWPATRISRTDACRSCSMAARSPRAACPGATGWPSGSTRRPGRTGWTST